MNTGETAVLVVEPDLDTQRVYRQHLIHDPDIKLIGICSSIASATALLAQTNCDILFTELNLPDEDGLDFIPPRLRRSRGSKYRCRHFQKLSCRYCCCRRKRRCRLYHEAGLRPSRCRKLHPHSACAWKSDQPNRSEGLS